LLLKNYLQVEHDDSSDSSELFKAKMPIPGYNVNFYPREDEEGDHFWEEEPSPYPIVNPVPVPTCQIDQRFCLRQEQSTNIWLISVSLLLFSLQVLGECQAHRANYSIGEGDPEAEERHPRKRPQDQEFGADCAQSHEHRSHSNLESPAEHEHSSD